MSTKFITALCIVSLATFAASPSSAMFMNDGSIKGSIAGDNAGTRPSGEHGMFMNDGSIKGNIKDAGVRSSGNPQGKAGDFPGRPICGKCDPIDVESGKTVTTTSGQWSVEGGAVGPVPTINAGYKSSTVTETRFYDKSVPAFGMDGDGAACGCSRNIDHRRF